MGPSPHFRAHRRSGISELYASMLMVGVTLVLGGLVTSSAIGQFSFAGSSASLVGAVGANPGSEIGLVYFVAVPSGSCPADQGYREGTSVNMAFYDYGDSVFAPVEIALNGSVYAGSYVPIGPGGMGAYSLNLASCARSPGETVTLVDRQGDEVQFAT